MLIAKITPAAKQIVQTTPFETSEISAEYMAAIARPYALGASKVNFEVVFGNLVESTRPGSEEVTQQFVRVTNTNVELEGEALASWGTDDSVILNAIAAKLGTSVVSTVSVSNQVGF
jgi:ribosome biogenesis protein Nip4